MGEGEQIKQVISSQIKKFMISHLGEIIPILGILVLMVLIVCIQASEGTAAESTNNTLNWDSANPSNSLVDYLLYFGGTRQTYQIDGREFYKGYDDGCGNFTIGRDVYVNGAPGDFQKSGYISYDGTTSQQVHNVYDVAMSEFHNGRCIYIEKELCDASSNRLVQQKMTYVDELEKELNENFSAQQKYALCALYYRRFFKCRRF